MVCGAALARAAAGMLGCPFRLYGRDPARGLDCVGLVCASLEALGLSADWPAGYRLRNSAISSWLACAERSHLTLGKGPLLPGDIVLFAPGLGQQHLVIVDSGEQMIHAHAGLCKVVRQPLALPNDRLAHWRLA
jgi:cell wall-associated NlpC family hydrolase